MTTRCIITAYKALREKHPRYRHVPLYNNPDDPNSSDISETLMRAGVYARYFNVTDDPTELEALGNYVMIKQGHVA